MLFRYLYKYFSLVERFGSDYDQTMKNHCLRVFGVPLDETIDGEDDADKFSMETLPRIAEVFLN